jgi:hypothetical protein
VCLTWGVNTHDLFDFESQSQDYHKDSFLVQEETTLHLEPRSNPLTSQPH